MPSIFHWINNVTRILLIVFIFFVGADLKVGPYLRVGPPMAFAQTPAQPQQQEEFIPIDQLPPQDQLPAAPLLITAYSVVTLALFGYVLSVARRMGSVQREIERLESDIKRGTRA
jgi:CcmD family protein